MSSHHPVEPRVAYGNGAVTIVSDLFGTDRREWLVRFLARAFSVPEVASVSARPAERSLTIVGRTTPRLAAAIRGEEGSVPLSELPPFDADRPFEIRRHRSILTRCRIPRDRPGDLRLEVPGLRGNAALAERLRRGLGDRAKLAALPSCVWTGVASIRYDPGVESAESLIRIADLALAGAEGAVELAAGPPVKFGAANTSLAYATAGELVLPLLAPVSAALLVASNLATFQEARDQIRRRELGLPVLYSTIVGATLAAGQFVPSALMTWLFRYWRNRHRAQLAVGRERLLSEHLPAARLARRGPADEPELFVEAERLRPGDVVTSRTGEILPADGVVLEGEGVVDERRVLGLDGVSRRRAGDRVAAGSTLLAGELRITVERAGAATRAAEIRRALIRATSPAPEPGAPAERSRRFASKAVGPTLAAAGVGLLTGDVATASAILRPDYATGPGLAVPVEAIADVDDLLRRGVLLRDPEALSRLAEIDLLVVEDQPALRRRELEVAAVHATAPRDLVLGLAVGLHRHLDDPRAGALARAARTEGVPIPRLEPTEYLGGVAARRHGRLVRTREHAADAAETGPLALEVDGVVVGLIEFRTSLRPSAAAALGRVRELSGVPMAFLSDQPPEEAGRTAAELGIELFRGGLSRGATAALVRECGARGLRIGYAGHGRSRPFPAGEASVAITLGAEGSLEDDPAGVVIPQPDPTRLPFLWESSRSHVERVRTGRRLILLPNLFCVAGAFFLGFNGLTSVVVSNLGTYSLFRRSQETLRSLDRPSGRPRGASGPRSENPS